MTAVIREYRGFLPRDERVAALLGEERKERNRLGNIRREEYMKTPFVGVTADGNVEPSLFPVQQTGVSTQAIKDAAEAYLRSLAEANVQPVQFNINAGQWRRWNNALDVARHGLKLEDLADALRVASLGLLRATLSTTGYETAREVMRLNYSLAELLNEFREFGEWKYYVSLFGTPSMTEPWGWQIDGHHLNINCFVLGDQVVMTPTFLGAEPAHADSGLYAGHHVFDDEQERALALIRALSPEQEAKAVIERSIYSKDLPKERDTGEDGRQQGGQMKDNAVVPYEGLRASEMTPAQRGMLTSLIDAYIRNMRPGHYEVRMAEIAAYMDETYFAWMGAYDGPTTPFYYRIHSPVVLIEFDCHRGVFINNTEPERFHLHLIVRTPNGNDYGKDLLRQHLERHHSK